MTSAALARRGSRFCAARRWLAPGMVALAALGGTLAAGVVAPGDASAQSMSRRAWLGVELKKGASGGVVAKHVITQSPAGKAGLVDGDLLLTADGARLDQPDQLVARVALVGPNNPLKLGYRRAGTDREVTITLAPHPGPDAILRLDKVGTFAPAWKSMTSISGPLPANVSELRGRVVLVDFWATWCRPCRAMSPQLTKWQAQYGAQGLSVVGLTTDPPKVATQTAQELDMRYAVGSDDSEATMEAYGVRSLPTLFVVDKKGVIREVLVGYDPARHREVEQLFKTLLAEPAPK